MRAQRLAVCLAGIVIASLATFGAPGGGRLPTEAYASPAGVDMAFARPVAGPSPGGGASSVLEKEYVFVSSGPLAEDELDELSWLGLSVEASAGGLTFVSGPSSSFEALGPDSGALEWVDGTLPALPLLTSDNAFPSSLTPLSETQLLEAVGADLLRASGLTGRMVRIAVLDSGYDGSLAEQLPEGRVQYLKVIWAEDGTPQLAEGYYDGSHGEACARAIASIAPGARYYLVSMQGLDDRRAVLEFVRDGELAVDVISDSTFWALPLDHNDGQGPLALAASAVVDMGVAYFHAVGNFGRGENTDRAFYCGVYANEDGDSDRWHDFDPDAASDLDRNSLAFEVAAWEGDTSIPIWVMLEWDGWPWQVKDNPQGIWTTNSIIDIQDLDLILYHEGLDGTVTEIARSDINQLRTLTGNKTPPWPLEYLTEVKLTEPGTYFVRVANLTLLNDPKFHPFERPVEFHLYVYLPEGGTTFTMEHHTTEGCLINEAAGAVVDVGAVGKTPEGWCAMPFSGRGPTTDGRLKPEVVAPTEYMLSGAAAAFGGTSAAAPIAAGVAALLLQEWPWLTQYELANAMMQTATPLCGISDLNGECAESCVCNNTVGHGLLNGWEAYLDLEP